MGEPHSQNGEYQKTSLRSCKGASSEEIQTPTMGGNVTTLSRFEDSGGGTGLGGGPCFFG